MIGGRGWGGGEKKATILCEQILEAVITMNFQRLQFLQNLAKIVRPQAGGGGGCNYSLPNFQDKQLRRGSHKMRCLNSSESYHSLNLPFLVNPPSPPMSRSYERIVRKSFSSACVFIEENRKTRLSGGGA
jgi:hypothetical protein